MTDKFLTKWSMENIVRNMSRIFPTDNIRGSILHRHLPAKNFYDKLVVAMNIPHDQLSVRKIPDESRRGPKGSFDRLFRWEFAESVYLEFVRLLRKNSDELFFLQCRY